MYLWMVSDAGEARAPPKLAKLYQRGVMVERDLEEVARLRGIAPNRSELLEDKTQDVEFERLHVMLVCCFDEVSKTLFVKGDDGIFKYNQDNYYPYPGASTVKHEHRHSCR